MAAVCIAVDFVLQISLFLAVVAWDRTRVRDLSSLHPVLIIFVVSHSLFV
jgi:hypothetical protein